MPKKTLNARVSDGAITNLHTYMQTNKFTKTEALEQILNSLLVQSPLKEPSSSGASDLYPCRQRVQAQGKNYCLVSGSHFQTVKWKELFDLEICNVCLSIRKNLPLTTKLPQETFDRGREPVRDPNKTDMPRDMKYCPEGLWVVKTKCVACRAKNYAVWFDCQKQGYLKKDAAVQRLGS